MSDLICAACGHVWTLPHVCSPNSENPIGLTVTGNTQEAVPDE